MMANDRGGVQPQAGLMNVRDAELDPCAGIGRIIDGDEVCPEMRSMLANIAQSSHKHFA